MLKFPDFQLDDIPRLALLDGAICGWEQGLGKSIAAIALALVKRPRRVLLIAPDDLHQQHKTSAMDFFGVHLTTLERIEQLVPYGLNSPASAVAAEAEPRFFITSFHNLGFNHADEWAANVGDDALAKTNGARQRARLEDLATLIPAHMRAKLSGKGALDGHEWFAGIGAERGGIRCVWKPVLARVLATYDTFDMVLVDEGTLMQADGAHIATGVRMLNPASRYVFTGTPIKNRVDSLFWLLKWVAGNQAGPTARFPYAATAEAREEFANHYLQLDKFLTREEEAERAHYLTTGKRRRYNIEKRTARLCNVHRFWKIISPLILRRRKDDCGLPIVKKIVRPIHAPPGRMQQEVYAFHLANPPLAGKATPHKPVDRRVQVGMQLTILRQAALCPHAESLAASVTSNTRFQGGAQGPKKSWTDLTPKMGAILAQLATVIASGEQAIVGSPFEPFNSALQRRLAVAGVSSILLDGSVSAKARGKHAARFKDGEYSVVVAGLKAMGKGHSFECAKNLFIPSLSWALDENEQFIHRVWRLNSKADVNIFTFTTNNTIDTLMNADFADKLDSAQLGLDGCLIEQQVEAVDMQQLLEKAMRSFDPRAETMDEADMEREWESTLRWELHRAEQSYRGLRRARQAAQAAPEDDGPSPLARLLAMRKKMGLKLAA